MYIMKCTKASVLLTLIGIVILCVTILFTFFPAFLASKLGYGFCFQSMFFGSNKNKCNVSIHNDSTAQNTLRQPELISLKVISRSRRSRRHLKNSVVIELFSPKRNETIIANASDSSDILSSDLVLFLDGQELETESTTRSKRSVRTLTEQNRFYTGTVSSDSGGSGRIALTSFESMGDEPEGFYGLLSLDGVDYLIEPSPKLGQANHVDSHFLIQANGDTGGRKCVSREMNHPEEMRDKDLLMASQYESDEAEVIIQTKTQPNKGAYIKTSSRVLELALFADAALFRKMKKKFPQKTLQNTITYLLASVNNMNLLYKDPSIGFDNKIDIRLNYLEVLTKNPKKLNDAKGRENVYLDSFCKFAASKNTDVTNWDHAMMLTGTDLRAADSAGVLGVAFTGALCDNRYSCSLIEAANFLGTYTMTHELGHSLGMNHDGEENNKHCSPSKYIMAAIEGAGQLTWSLCSQQNLRDYLHKRSSIRGASNPGCLRTTYKRKKNKKPIQYQKNKLPGEIYSAIQQCAMSLGKKYIKPVYKTGYHESMCYELKCSDGSKTIATQPALEGTICGKQMWCKGGFCVLKLPRAVG